MPYCIGCRPRNKKCSFVKKKCDKLLKNNVGFCYQCKDFPCELIAKLSKSYEKYRISMLENLLFIKEFGLEKFLKSERKKWECSICGKIICCHNGICCSCELKKMKTKKKRYK